MNKTLKNELYNVLSGKSAVSFGTPIQAITRYLGDGVESSSDAQIQKQFKKQEEERLIQFIELNQLWINDIDFSKYISEGAEQKVFLNDERHVIKLNDTIYYPTWLAYFQNLILSITSSLTRLMNFWVSPPKVESFMPLLVRNM